MEGAVLELKSQARCLVGVEGDADRNRFLVSTLNLRSANEVRRAPAIPLFCDVRPA